MASQLKFKHMGRSLGVFILTVFCLGGITLLRADTLLPSGIDVPGALDTYPLAINNDGQIVGYYNAGTGNQGFLYSGGAYTTINFPASNEAVYLTGINDSGEIVGYYLSNLTGVTTGFSYSSGNFTLLPFLPESINDSGQIVGGTSAGALVLDSGGTITPITLPFSVYGDDEFLTGINDTGEMVGYFYDGVTGYHGFLDDAGNFTLIDVPTANACCTYVSGINDSGQIVGHFQGTSGSEGFLDDAGSFTTLDVAAVTGYSTSVNGINDAGQIVGTFAVAGGDVNGYIMSPAPTPEGSPLLMVGSGMICLAFVKLHKFGIAGAIAKLG